MAAVPEGQRIAALRRLGVSEALVRLACGDCLHSTFRNICLGPPFYPYQGARVPDGPPLVPLWDHGGTVIGVRERDAGLEFVEFSIELDDEVRPLSRSEQGFWITRFDYLYESDVPDAELRAAAATVGFRFLDRLVASREESADRLITFEAHTAWLQELVASIDGESLNAEAFPLL